MQFLNGVPAAWWMDIPYTSPFERPDFTPVSALFLRSKNATLGGEEDFQLDWIGIVFDAFISGNMQSFLIFLLAVVLVLP